jgi:Ni,Fe-hydrogenase I cytochrome b subunit
MNHWILLSVVVLAVLGYFVVMRAFFQRSREADKQVDYSKIRPWNDDED